MKNLQTTVYSLTPCLHFVVLEFLPVADSFIQHGVAGLRAYYTIYDSEGLDDDIKNEFNLGYHFGFGLEVLFNQNVALNADYRYLFLNSADNEESFDGEFSGNALTVGLKFYLQKINNH